MRPSTGVLLLPTRAQHLLALPSTFLIYLGGFWQQSDGWSFQPRTPTLLVRAAAERLMCLGSILGPYPVNAVCIPQ